MKFLTASLGALAVTAIAMNALAPSARADIPPGPDYVETCTVEKQTTAGHECQSCNAWHGDVDACDKTLGKDGYSKACKGWGASSWTEVWCRAKAGEPTPATTTPPTTDGATTSPATAPKTAAGGKCAAGGVELGAGLVMALAVLARRTRKAR